MPPNLSQLSMRDLDDRIYTTTVRLNADAKTLERLLDERERRGDGRQIALTEAAFAWLAAGEAPVAGVVH